MLTIYLEPMIKLWYYQWRVKSKNSHNLNKLILKNIMFRIQIVIFSNSDHVFRSSIKKKTSSSIYQFVLLLHHRGDMINNSHPIATVVLSLKIVFNENEISLLTEKWEIYLICKRIWILFYVCFVCVWKVV